MAVDLSGVLVWDRLDDETTTMLQSLQANIIESHVRSELVAVLLRFGDMTSGRRWLAELARPGQEGSVAGTLVAWLKSASEYRAERELPKEQERVYVGLGLSAAGYQALGVPERHIPADPAFRAGMRAVKTAKALGDPAADTWESPYDQGVHAVVLISGRNHDSVMQVHTEITDSLEREWVVGIQQGQLERQGTKVVEHFGFVDGISNPQFARTSADPPVEPMRWDPALPLDRVLVRDPGAVDNPAADPNPYHGSYLVYRKLAQDVERFEAAATAIAKQVGDDVSADTVKHLLIGRQQDGTPLVEHEPGELNSFTYARDLAGARCPFAAHIHKMNPRLANSPSDRRHLMARRGITYRDGKSLGLLFMAVNADLGQQFQFVQKRWANDESAPKSGLRASGGMDQIIGQGERLHLVLLPGSESRLGYAVTPVDPQVVTMLGGEYFFLPSLETLRRLPTLR